MMPGVWACGRLFVSSSSGHILSRCHEFQDGLLKYTLGPAIFRRDRRARCMASGHDMPLGHSLHSIQAGAQR